MFDETGAHYQLKPRCILDFYIHESRQRMGLGNILYQHMLSVSGYATVPINAYKMNGFNLIWNLIYKIQYFKKNIKKKDKDYI